MFDYVFLFGTIIFTFLAIVLLVHLRNQKANRSLAALNLTLALMFFMRFLANLKSPALIYLPLLVFPMASLMGSLIYAYARRVLFDTGLARRELAGLTVFPVLVLIAQVTAMTLIPETHNVDFLLDQKGSLRQFTFCIFQAIFSYNLVFCLFALRFTLRARGSMDNEYAYSDKAGFEWIFSFVIINTLALMAALAGLFKWYYSAEPIPFGAPEAFFFLVSLLIILYFQMTRPQIFNHYEEVQNEPQKARYENLTFSESEIEATWQKLEKAMGEQRLFLKDELSLSELGRTLGVARHNLSMVVNRKAGHSFFHYVNAYRVEFAKKLLQDQAGDTMPVYRIASEAGFQSTTSFHRIFKRATGKTPANYWKESQPKTFTTHPPA